MIQSRQSIEWPKDQYRTDSTIVCRLRAIFIDRLGPRGKLFQWCDMYVIDFRFLHSYNDGGILNMFLLKIDRQYLLKERTDVQTFWQSHARPTNR